jgi:hypothetical protein
LRNSAVRQEAMPAKGEVLEMYRILLRHVRMVEKPKQRELWWAEARSTFRQNSGETDAESVGKMVHVAQQKLSFLRTITNHGMKRYALKAARTKPMHALPEDGKWQYMPKGDRPDFYPVDRSVD